MDNTSLSTGPAPSAEELALVAAFVRATNAGELAALEALFAADALVNDQLRNFWGIQEIRAWLEREIVGERVALKVLRVRKHYDAIIATAEISGEFETPRLPQPMTVDLHFTLQDARIVRLLVLLARDDTPEPDIRRAP